ncbi:MAG: AAA family ATPase, partial [Burkholderiales bacterium]|nr:AAA family ATPase [Burkholderiales bacterium]
SSFVLKRSGNLAPINDVAETSVAADLPTSRPGLAETEAAMLRAAVAEANGNLSLAARVLGITRPKLAYRLRKYGIPVDRD